MTIYIYENTLFQNKFSLYHSLYMYNKELSSIFGHLPHGNTTAIYMLLRTRHRDFPTTWNTPHFSTAVGNHLNITVPQDPLI